jgi:ketosteroid isomerase-like protein
MSVSTAGEIMRRFYKDFGTGNIDAALSACTEDLEIVDPGMGDVHGRERFREYLETFKRAMPDARALIDQTVESGETVASAAGASSMAPEAPDRCPARGPASVQKTPWSATSHKLAPAGATAMPL